MKNMTSDHYPHLCPRQGRQILRRTASPQGLVGKDVLCYVDGSDFVAGEAVVPMGLSTAAADCPKTLTSMGAFVIIMPDKKYINTRDLSDFGDIECAFTGTVTVEPEEEGFVCIRAADIGTLFRPRDGVHLLGFEATGLSGTAVVKSTGEDLLVVAGNVEDTVQEANVTIARRMPLMDHLTEAGNRLWGCRYGPGADGQFVNEIYASALGDFRNWQCFEGLSTDSYCASCGTDGPFTGAVTYLGAPLFFKENCVHKVYGSYPAAFRIQDTACRGVEAGSHRSLALVDEVLFYKSRSGICAYDGSLPVCVSRPLGKTVYSHAVGGSCGGKYYVSMEDEAGASHLFVFDTARSLWHREDGLRVSDFCSLRGQLYGIDADSCDILVMTGGSTDPVEWMAQTGRLLLHSPQGKTVSRLQIRLLLEQGAKAELFARYDGCGEWEPVCAVFGTSLRTFNVPVRPRRCDSMELRIEGRGMGRILSVTARIRQEEGG